MLAFTFLLWSRCRGTKTQKPFALCGWSWAGCACTKGRKSLVQTELWSWVLAGFPSSLSPLRFLGIKKKKSKHTNQVFLFTVFREGRHFGKSRSFPQVIQEGRENNSVKKLWLQIFGIFFAKFYKREIHPEFWELLQAAREGLIACLIFFWEEENSPKGVWMAEARLGFCSSLRARSLWGRVSVAGLETPCRRLLSQTLAWGENAPLWLEYAGCCWDFLARWEVWSWFGDTFHWTEGEKTGLSWAFSLHSEYGKELGGGREAAWLAVAAALHLPPAPSQHLDVPRIGCTNMMKWQPRKKVSVPEWGRGPDARLREGWQGAVALGPLHPFHSLLAGQVQADLSL